MTAPVDRMMLFLRGLVYGLGGILIGWVLVRSVRVSIGPFAVVLAALGLTKTMEYLFARHREACWAPEGNPEGASVELAGNLLAVQFGILLGFAIFATALPGAVITELFQFQLRGVFVHQIPSFGPFHNSFTVALMSGLSVMCISFFLGAIYQEGGISLTVSWVGSLWGIALVSLLRRVGFDQHIGYVAFVLLSLLAGSIGFMTSGMAGLFLARGTHKYAVGSKEHHSITRTCLLLFACSMAFVLFSAALSAWVGARVL